MMLSCKQERMTRESSVRFDHSLVGQGFTTDDLIAGVPERKVGRRRLELVDQAGDGGCQPGMLLSQQIRLEICVVLVRLLDLEGSVRVSLADDQLV